MSRHFLALFPVFMAACSHAPQNATPLLAPQDTVLNELPPIPTLSDPMEPWNRGVWAVNKKLLNYVVHPTTSVYRGVVPSPARRSIGHFATNITFPGRLVNESLQGRWSDAGNESLRFLTNSTLGVAGLFDVASRFNIPKPKASFNQTFTHWGWNRSTYVMLPFLGPSDEVNLTGSIGDRALEPWFYLEEPLVFAAPISSVNELSESTPQRVQFIESDADSYATIKYLWSNNDLKGDPDWKLNAKPDVPTLETLQVAQLRCKDAKFPLDGREISFRLSSTGKTFRATAWMQKKPAPLVYINPGLGSHRISNTPAFIAEFLFQQGYSVVSVSSLFHPEFIESALTSALPAYPLLDGQDLLVALTELDQVIQKKYPSRIASRSLLGLSMGAYQTLYLAANDQRYDSKLIRFDRYVAIDSPVNLPEGIQTLDRFYASVQDWPRHERTSRLKNTFHKIISLQNGDAPRDLKAPFGATESQFLVGLTFRFILRDAIFSSQSKHNLGVLKSPMREWRRDGIYQEILTKSYRDYFLKFVLPYYQSKGISLKHFAKEGNLKNFSKQLAKDSRIRVIANRNDFLLKPSDATWLTNTLPASRLHLFPNGGHLGNLNQPAVQQAILSSLAPAK